MKALSILYKDMRQCEVNIKKVELRKATLYNEMCSKNEYEGDYLWI